MHFLYKIINTQNNKIYIGQSVSPNARWSQHKFYAKCDEPNQYIGRAIKKYGVENFTFEIIDFAMDRWQAGCLEKCIIEKYNSRNPSIGYNVAPGGDIPWNLGRKFSEETIKKMSETAKKRIVSEEEKIRLRTLTVGLKMSDEAKKKISNFNKGKIISEETKQKLSESKSGDRSNLAKLNWKIVEQIRSDYATGLFSYSKLSKKYNVHSNTVRFIIVNKTWKIKDIDNKPHEKSRSDEIKNKISMGLQKYSEEQMLEMVRLHNLGLSNIKIAKQYGCSEGTVRKAVKRYSI